MEDRLYERDADDSRILFYDVQIVLDGVEYSCDGEAEYQTVNSSREEWGIEYEYEDLEIVDLSVKRWDGYDWIDAPELANDKRIEAELIETLDY
jgi:hypothetical protein